MKKIFFSAIVLGALVVSGCGLRSWLQNRFSSDSSPTTDQKSNDTTTYAISPASSTLKWSLKNVRGFTGAGGVGFSSGSIIARHGIVEKVNAVLDSGSFLKNGNTLAADHFKLDTYLMAAKYLTITFDSTDIISVDPVAGQPTAYQVTGTVSAGFWSRSITFPATFVIDGDKLAVQGEITIPTRNAGASATVPAEVVGFLGKTGSATITLQLEAQKQ